MGTQGTYFEEVVGAEVGRLLASGELFLSLSTLGGLVLAFLTFKFCLFYLLNLNQSIPEILCLFLLVLRIKL